MAASQYKMAEEEGFEPSRQDLAHQHAFQACALNRSATPPQRTPQHGGEGGIRTHETGLNRLPDFESGSFDQLRHLSVSFYDIRDAFEKTASIALGLHQPIPQIRSQSGD